MNAIEFYQPHFYALTNLSADKKVLLFFEDFVSDSNDDGYMRCTSDICHAVRFTEEDANSLASTLKNMADIHLTVTDLRTIMTKEEFLLLSLFFPANGEWNDE